MKPLTEPLYLLDCPNALSSWKVWQQKTFGYARQFNLQIFNKAGIEAFREKMQAVADSCRNHEEVGRPDWEWAEKYGRSVHISIGGGCGVSFMKIAGIYDGNGKGLL